MVLELHRLFSLLHVLFLIAMRLEAPRPQLVPSQGDAESCRNHDMLLGPNHILSSAWVGTRLDVIDAADVAFLSTLHWLFHADTLGVVGGISFVELLILDELWAGERLVLEKAISPIS